MANLFEMYTRSFSEEESKKYLTVRVQELLNKNRTDTDVDSCVESNDIKVIISINNSNSEEICCTLFDTVHKFIKSYTIKFSEGSDYLTRLENTFYYAVADVLSSISFRSCVTIISNIPFISNFMNYSKLPYWLALASDFVSTFGDTNKNADLLSLIYYIINSGDVLKVKLEYIN